MSNVKGSAVLSRLRFVEDRHGRDARDRLVRSLSQDARLALDGAIAPHQWISYDLFVEVNVAADEMFGKGDLQLCYEMGKYGAEVNLPTLYRVFYRFGSPEFIFKKAARLWEVHYDSGRLVPIFETPTRMRMRIVEFEKPHRAHCLSVLGWAARSLEMSGPKVTRADEEKCRVRGDAACEHVVEFAR